MFVERLKKEDFAQFIANDEYIQERYKKLGDNIVDAIYGFEIHEGLVKFSVGNVTFVFTDFDYSNNYMFRSYNGSNHNKDWLAFMFKKFGVEYKHEFYKFRSQEKRRLLKHVSSRIHADNARYEKVFQGEEQIEN